MKPIRIFFKLAIGILAGTALGQGTNSAAAASTPLQLPAVRVVALPTPDGVTLKASYFAAAKPGPGVLLFHQSNRTRQSWDDLARQMAAAGINTLTIDGRGYGESGGQKEARELYRDGDLDAAFEYLVSRPGVEHGVIGAGGAGWLGVDNSVELARRHAEVKSLVLMSGETLLPQLRFLRQASQLPGLFIVSDDDEYPPTVEAMEWLYDCSSSPQKQFIHYIGPKAPWLWYETSDASKVPATGSHGTDLFQRHADLPATIVDWFVTTLIRTPGHTPADAVAAAVILNQIEMPGGVVQVKHRLKEARDKDPTFQLWPEVNVDIIGEDHMRLADAETKAGHLQEAEMERKVGIEIFELNLLAYPDSADAHANLADAYLADGQKELAREYAERALAMIDSHRTPLSSWSDTEQRRTEVRNDVLDVLKKLGASESATRTERAPDSVP
jgi:dienelactone hydrolase